MSLLFESKRVGNLEVKNRLMRSATAERLVDKSGGVTDELVGLYKRLAQGEIGTIITGYTSIHPRGRSGWVTTAATSSPAARMASRDGRANWGVPMKIRRQGPDFTWPPPVFSDVVSKAPA